MLKYIHQFVQTFLREAAKSRPRSRASSKSSTELTKGKSLMKPEMLAIDFNNEGYEAERSKEILELKRTYSLLMKKFVNPKLDILTRTKIESDINILSLKGKQELIKSIMKRIFDESTRRQRELEGSSTDFSVTKVKPIIDEEPAFGWTGQRTSKVAAKPMVETSHSKNTATTRSSPETQVEPSNKNSRQANRVPKQRYKINSPKNQSIKLYNSKNQPKSKKLSELEKKNMETNLYNLNFKNQHSKEKDISEDSNNVVTNTNLNTENFKDSVAESKETKINSDNIKDNCFSSKKSFKKPLQASLQLNNVPVINSSYSARTDEIQHNQKKNLDIIRAITKAGRSKTLNTNTPHLKEKTNKPKNVMKSTTTDLSTEKINVNNIPQNVFKNTKPSDEKKKINNRVLIKKKPQNEKRFVEKSEHPSSPHIIPKELSDSSPNEFSLAAEKALKLTDKAVNEAREKVELSNRSFNSRREIIKENTITAAENLSNSNIKTLENEPSQSSSIKVETVNSDLNKPFNSDNRDQGKTDVGKSSKEVINEQTKTSDKSYWSFISEKLVQTSNNAQQFINSFEMSNWKTKDVSTSDLLNKELIENGISEKQTSLELSNDNYKMANNSDVKARSNVQSNLNGVTDLKAKKYQTSELETSVSDSKLLALNEEKQYLPKKIIQSLKRVNSLEPHVTDSSRKISKSKHLDNTCAQGTNNSTKKLTSPRNTNNNKGVYKEKQLENDFESKTGISKIKSTAGIDSRNDANCRTEIDTKENYNFECVKNIVPEGDGKIKKLVRRFKKMQRNKSKENVGSVQQIYNKFLNHGKLSLYKLKIKQDKNTIQKIKQVMRTKSDKFATDEHLSFNIPTKEKSRPMRSSNVESRTSSLSKSKNKSEIRGRKISIRSTRTLNKAAKGFKVNRVDSNIFPSVSKSIIKNEFIKDDHQPTVSNSIKKSPSKQIYQNNTTCDKSNKIKTEFDLNKPRKLHTTKKIPKKINLKMYGTKRSIYTHSNREKNLSKSVFNIYDSENIGEPHLSNMTSASLIKVNKVTPKRCRSSATLIHVRNMYTTGSRGKVKQPPKKRRSTIMKQNKETKPALADSTTMKISAHKGNTSDSKSKEIKLKSNNDLSSDKSLNEECIYVSPKVEDSKENPSKDLQSNHEIQMKIAENKTNCSLKDRSNDSLLSSSVKNKVDDKIEVLYRKPEKIGNIHKTSNFKKDTLLETNSTDTPLCLEDIKVKVSESILNVQSQNNPQSNENEIVTDTPKWRSKGDRLKKLKLEADSCNTKETEEKTNLDVENYSKDVKIEGSKTNENIVTSVKDDGKKENSFDHKDETSKHLANEKTVQDHFQNVKKDITTYNDTKNKIIKAENENKMSQKTGTKPFTAKKDSVQNKCENNNMSSQLVLKTGADIKTDSSTYKIREFESKLKTLESQLRALELKSISNQNFAALYKMGEQKDTSVVNSSAVGNHLTNKNKISGNKATKLDEENTSSQNNTKKKKSESLGLTTTNQNKNKMNLFEKHGNQSDKKNQNDPMKEHLSLKVRSLELKLKNLESKIQNLSVKPSDLVNNKEMHKKTSEGSIVPKHISNENKLDVRTNLLKAENNAQLANLNNRVQDNLKIQTKETSGGKTFVHGKSKDNHFQPDKKSSEGSTVPKQNFNTNKHDVKTNLKAENSAQLVSLNNQGQVNINIQNKETSATKTVFHGKPKVYFKPHKKFSEGNVVPKQLFNTNKLDDRTSLLKAENNSQPANLNNRGEDNIRIQNKETYVTKTVFHGKPKVYFKPHKNSLEGSIVSKHISKTNKLDERTNHLKAENYTQIANLNNRAQNNMIIPIKQTYGTKTVVQEKPEVHLEPDKISSEGSFLPKHIFNRNNLYEGRNLIKAENNAQLANLNTQGQDSIKTQNKETSGAKTVKHEKPKVYLEQLKKSSEKSKHISNTNKLYESKNLLKAENNAQQANLNNRGQDNIKNNETSSAKTVVHENPKVYLGQLKKPSEGSIVPKHISNTNKLYESTNLIKAGNSAQLANLNNRGQDNIKIHNKETSDANTVVHTKPEAYLKHFTMNNNNFKEKNDFVEKQNIFNTTKQPRNKSASPSLQNTSGKNEVKLSKNTKILEKIPKQKLLTKSIKMSGIKETNNKVLHDKIKAKSQNINSLLEKSNSIPIMSTDDMAKFAKLVNSFFKKSNSCVNQNVLDCAGSSTNNTNSINVTIPKGAVPSKSLYFVTETFKKMNGPNKELLESKTCKLKSSKGIENTKVKNTGTIVSRKKSLQKSVIVNKKTSQKSKTTKDSLKKEYNHFSHGLHKAEKPNVLHEGLLKSTRLLKSVRPNKSDTPLNVIKKVDSSTQVKHSAYKKNLKSPVLSKKVSKALSNITIIPEKRKYNKYTQSGLEHRQNVKSAGATTDKEIKVQTKGLKKSYNYFDYNRAKRRTYEVTQPIEKEKYGFELLKNVIVHDSLHTKNQPQNSILHPEYSVESYKRGKGSENLNKECNEKLDSLIASKHTTIVYPSRNEVVL